MSQKFPWVAVLLLAASTGASSTVRDAPAGLHQALNGLTREGRFSGAVVILTNDRIRFSRGYGFADPFSGHRYTADTPADSASVPKPMTAAAVLMLARDGKVDLDAPVRRYVLEYPHAVTTVRQLLAHSAGLSLKESAETLNGKNNSALIVEAGKLSPEPSFPPGSAFEYCNLCTVTLAILIERVTGQHYLQVLRDKLRLSPRVTVRPQRLSEWKGRAIGYRRGAGGKPERLDRWEGEAFYGSGNLSISASQLAAWGAEWWKAPLATLRADVTAPAMIGDKISGLTIGNWYCAKSRSQCHYGGHHEGFHHVYYWDSERRIALALMTNNTLEPALQHRLARALVAFAEGRAVEARRELSNPLSDLPLVSGTYRLPNGDSVAVTDADQRVAAVHRGGLSYQTFRVGKGIRYVPGLDVLVSGTPRGRMHWLSLYEDFVAQAAK